MSFSFYVGSTVDTYKNIKISDPWNQTSCASCINDYQDTDRVVKLACGHIFHESCYNTATGYRNLQGIKASCLTCVRESYLDPNQLLLNSERNLVRLRGEIGRTINELQEMREGQRPREVENSTLYQTIQILRMSDEEKRQTLEFARLHDPVGVQKCEAEREIIDRYYPKAMKVLTFAVVASITGLIGCLALDYYSTGS